MYLWFVLFLGGKGEIIEEKKKFGGFFWGFFVGKGGSSKF